MISMCAPAQDANGDSDLWDLAITEAGEAVRHPTSTSPFASKALLTCFNSDVRLPRAYFTFCKKYKEQKRLFVCMYRI